MAKQRKKTKAIDRNAPLAALYGFDAGTERGDALRAVLAETGIRVRTVAPERLADPVGAIAGMVGFRPSPTPFAGEAPHGEFMLLANVGSKALDRLLAALREGEIQVDHKAVVTKYNRSWPFIRLMEEVADEHAAVSGAQGE